MQTVTPARESLPTAVCDWCEERPNRPCPACNTGRPRAVRCVEGEDLPVTEAAARMRLPVGHAERLLEEEDDRRIVAQFRQSHVENAVLRQRLRERQRVDPTLTMSEVARRIGTSPSQPERWLGLRPTAPKTDSRGRTYPGRILKTISVENAGPPGACHGLRVTRHRGLRPVGQPACGTLEAGLCLR